MQILSRSSEAPFVSSTASDRVPFRETFDTWPSLQSQRGGEGSQRKAISREGQKHPDKSEKCLDTQLFSEDLMNGPFDCTCFR